MPQESHYYTYPRQVARKAYMKAMDTKKDQSNINVPLFEPLVPELDSNHFEAGRSPFNVVKPHIIVVCLAVIMIIQFESD